MANEVIEFQDNFETGSSIRWSVAESDGASQLDFPHYSVLAQRKDMPMPYSGAYLARWILAASTTAATIGEAEIDGADGTTNWIRMRIWIGSDLATKTTSDDTFPLLELQRTTTNSVQYAFGLRVVAATNVVNFGVGVLAPTAFGGEVALDTWNTVELKVNVQTGAGTGEIEMYVTRDGGVPPTSADASVATNQSDNAVVRGILGTQDVLNTTNGTICINDFKMQVDNRIWPERNRFKYVVPVTQSGHVFFGAGTVENVVLIGSGTDDEGISIYDSDTGDNTDELKTTVAATTSVEGASYDADGVPIDMIRGCYVYVFGTGAEPTHAPSSAVITALITISHAPNWFSDGNIRRFASRRNLSG